MRKRLKYIDPTVTSKVFAVLYGLIGAIAGVVFLLVAIFSKRPDTLAVAIFVPVGYSVAGFVGGYVLALIYNLVAEWTGGLEFELDDVVTAKPERSPFE